MNSKFLQDPKYLTKYYVKTILMLLACIFVSAFVKSSMYMYYYVPAFLLLIIPNIYAIILGCLWSIIVSCFVTHVTLTSWIFLPSLATLITLLATSYIHNAAHGNFKPWWLNRLVGELCGLFQLVGFPDWTIVHMLHHKYADDPLLDPHPPQNKSYWKFTTNVKDSIYKVYSTYYFQTHGKNTATENIWRSLPVLVVLTQLLKVVFWFIVLDPTIFSLFFVVSLVAKNLHYAMFNWLTHKPVNGIMTIRDVNTGIFRIINYISHGLYFHAAHHKHPRNFNPRKNCDDTNSER